MVYPTTFVPKPDASKFIYIASLKYEIFFLNDVMSQMLIIPETSYFGI